jgi:gamma-glutamylcyclotransferase (GGCT)/AIG2-like uncharacterized protein YtfP
MTAEVLLFAYGTLQDPAVQTAVFGHALGAGASDRLSGFRLSHIPVDDLQVTAETGLTHYPILIPTTDDAPPVPGRLYPLTPADLTPADLTAADLTAAYEGEAYRRVRVTTQAGAEAWVYLAAEG